MKQKNIQAQPLEILLILGTKKQQKKSTKAHQPPASQYLVQGAHFLNGCLNIVKQTKTESVWTLSDCRQSGVFQTKHSAFFDDNLNIFLIYAIIL